MTTTVRDILKQKGGDVISVDAGQKVQDAVGIMASKNVGAVVVLSDGAVCGIFSERDYVKNMASGDTDLTESKVQTISSCNVVAVDPETTLEQSMAIMTQAHIRHLPVMEHGKLVGLISIGDLVKQASKDQEAKIHYLTDFVTGKYPG